MHFMSELHATVGEISCPEQRDQPLENSGRPCSTFSTREVYLLFSFHSFIAELPIGWLKQLEFQEVGFVVFHLN